VCGGLWLRSQRRFGRLLLVRLVFFFGVRLCATHRSQKRIVVCVSCDTTYYALESCSLDRNFNHLIGSKAGQPPLINPHNNPESRKQTNVNPHEPTEDPYIETTCSSVHTVAYVQRVFDVDQTLRETSKVKGNNMHEPMPKAHQRDLTISIQFPTSAEPTSPPSPHYYQHLDRNLFGPNWRRDG
jgi:hypothetical protein